METQAKTRKELASLYQIDVKTLQRWCFKYGIHLEKRDRISPKVVHQIYETFGYPKKPDDGAKRPEIPL